MHYNSEDAPTIRERTVPLFPRGMTYFRRWRTLRWFFVLVVPVFVSALSCYLRRHNLWEFAGILLFGAALSSALVVELASGVASSAPSNNPEMIIYVVDGTFFRNRNPILYWTQVGFTASAYLLVVVMGFALDRGKPMVDPSRPITAHTLPDDEQRTHKFQSLFAVPDGNPCDESFA